jgi:Ino eighty subunit 2
LTDKLEQMETINKLLKKQAPKINRKAQMEDEASEAESQRPKVAFVRWTNNKDGSRIAVPEEMLAGPVGKVFIPGGLRSGKMVEEVS